MGPESIYLPTAAVLLAIGIGGFVLSTNLLRKIIALNLMGAAIFLLLAVTAYRGSERVADPVPHALVITGIVVSFSATALAVGLARRIQALTHDSRLPEDQG